VSDEFRPDSERDALAALLDVQRKALLRKVEGLSEVDARRVPTASALSLLSLLKHSATWEERWFHGVVAGQPLADGWPEQKSGIPDADFLLGDEDTVDQWLTRYRDACELSRGIVAARELTTPCVRADIWTATFAGCCCTSSKRPPGTWGTPTSSGRPSTAAGACSRSATGFPAIGHDRGDAVQPS